MRSSSSVSGRSTKSRGRVIFLLASVLLFSLIYLPVQARSAEITLEWDTNSEPDLAGYRLYYGETSRQYSAVIEVGPRTIYTYTGLHEGMSCFFAVTAYDSNGNESDYSEELSYLVPQANHPPVAHGGATIIAEDTTVTGTLSACDADGNALTYSIVQQPGKGSVIITDVSTGAYIYTANANSNGADSFSFKANDGSIDSIPASVSVSITPVNDPPSASSGTLTATEDTAAMGTIAAADVDGDVLTYSIVQQPGKGSITITDVSTGAYIYTANANSNGADSFTFKANDGFVDSIPASVSVAITSVNDPPSASSGTLTATEDTAATGTIAAADVDGDVLTYSIVQQPGKGSITITDASTGAYTYTPNANSNGADSFTFKANDGSVDSIPASVSVAITSVNDPPSASSGTLTATEDTAATGTIAAADVDGDVLTYSIVQQPGKGSITITDASTGAYTYTPNANSNGADSFTFKANDGSVDSIPASVSVSIAPVNDSPAASDGKLSVLVGTVAGGKLATSDPDGDALSCVIVKPPAKGRVTIADATTGSFNYEPDAKATGADSFTFMAGDGEADSNVAKVEVTIFNKVQILLEAENGSLSPPVSVAEDKTAFGGRFAYVPNGQKGATTGERIEGGYAEYTFQVPVSAEYVVFARVKSADLSGKSFAVSMDNANHVTWNVARGALRTWFWDKVTDGSVSGPATFYLEAGPHTLVFEPQQAGCMNDRILITTWSDFLSGTGYEDGEDGTTGGWDVLDAAPAGAQITNVFDEDRQSNVIELKGSGIGNSYELLSADFSPWNNSSQFVAEWSLKYSEEYKVFISVNTTVGGKLLLYGPYDRDCLGKSDVVGFGLGNRTKDGRWHRIVRNLQADLAKAQPGVKITAVNSFAIRGSGRVDDIILRPKL